MSKTFWAALLCAGLPAQVLACDVCGCSASAQTLGILPRAAFNFIGLQWTYQQFDSDHPALFDDNRREQSTQVYHTAQLWGRYNLGSRLQMFAFLPVRSTVHVQDRVRSTESGLGDASVMLNAVVLRESGWDTAVQHSLIAGGGVKLPTGRYAGVRDADRQGLPNLQPGTGSVDFLVNASYTVRAGRTGLNADAAYTISLANNADYRYGNRFNAGLLLFRSLSRKRMQLLPQAGLRLEASTRDYTSWSRGWQNTTSGGTMLFAAAGVQGYRGKVGLRLLGQIPVAQRFAAGYVAAGPRVDAGAFFLF